MKKVIRLVRVQLWAVLADMLAIRGSKKKRPKMLYAGIAFFILLMSLISFFYCFGIASGLRLYGSTEILPSMMIAVTCMVLFFTTMLKVKGTIFGFKDYDMVMALPISTSGVVASRILILYAINMIFVVILIIPMMLAYGIIMAPSPLFYLYGLIALFFVPLIPIAFASIFGTIIAYLSSKFRHSNILSIILTMGLLIIIIGISFTINDDAQELVDFSREMSAQVKAIYPLAGLYMKAVVEYDIVSLLLFIGISLLAFLLYTITVKLVFQRLNTAIMTGSYRREYKLEKLKTSSPLKALYKKELRRYFSSTVYVINTSFAVLMLTVGTIALFFVDLDKLLGEEIPDNLVAMIGPVFLFFCVGLCSTTMSSISLEGKHLWIIKSLPVEPKQVYLSKIAVNLTILSPGILDALLLGIALKLDFIKSLLLVLITAILSIFISLYGLLINLLLPNFNWSNENVVVKQSAASFITIFSSMLFCVIPLVLTLLLPSMIIAYLAILFLFAGIDVILYSVLASYGKRRYAQL
jgi:ABC-2 type transport system permease protein